MVRGHRLAADDPRTSPPRLGGQSGTNDYEESATVTAPAYLTDPETLGPAPTPHPEAPAGRPGASGWPVDLPYRDAGLDVATRPVRSTGNFDPQGVIPYAMATEFVLAVVLERDWLAWLAVNAGAVALVILTQLTVQELSDHARRAVRRVR